MLVSRPVIWTGNFKYTCSQTCIYLYTNVYLHNRNNIYDNSLIFPIKKSLKIVYLSFKSFYSLFSLVANEAFLSAKSNEINLKSFINILLYLFFNSTADETKSNKCESNKFASPLRL